MTGKVFLTFGLVAILAALCSCASTAKFKSFDTTKSGDPQIIRGKLTKPSGDGPFPAVVLLHGSAGIKVRRNFTQVGSIGFGSGVMFL